jgi:hypothetical protein
MHSLANSDICSSLVLSVAVAAGCGRAGIVLDVVVGVVGRRDGV